MEHLKTTIDISDALFGEAKVIAASNGTTLRSLVEEGLRLAIARHEGDESFRLREGSFAGDGLRADVTLERWDGSRGFSSGGRSK